VTKRYHNTLEFSSLKRRKVEVNFEGGDITSDGGAILLREMDKRIGLTDAIDKWEANEYLVQLHARLNHFGLSLHPEKICLIRFGRYATAQGVERKEGKPKTFDFLGFTHYCTVQRNGEFKVGRKTIRKRLINQIKAAQHELRRRMH